MGGSPSGNSVHKQRRLYQVWRGGNVRFYLNFCFELVFMSQYWILMVIWLNVWSQFNLCFNSLYLIVYVSIMFCWKSCGFWTSLFCHYIFLFPSCEIEAFCWLVKDVSFNVMNVALWLRTSRVLMIACLRGLMVNWLFW